MNAYINSGMADRIVDPDNGANVAAKADRLRAAGVKSLNLQCVPPYPDAGWEKKLSEMPKFTFRTITEHFLERNVRDVVTGHSFIDTVAVDTVEASAACGSTEDDHDDPDEVASAAEEPVSGAASSVIDSLSSDDGDDDDIDTFRSFRGLAKGYRFFRSGHIQDIQHNRLPQHPGYCYIRCTVLPSMRKDRRYKVRLCCTTSESPADHIPTVLVALCTCPAGLAGCCNHVGGLLYALEDFVRLGLREEAGKTCTEKLMAWNQPCSVCAQPCRVTDVHLRKHTFAGIDRPPKKKKIPFFDPRPTNHRIPNSNLVHALTRDLKDIQTKGLEEDTTGHVAMYGTSTWLSLLEPSPPPSESSEGSSDDSESDSDDELPDTDERGDESTSSQVAAEETTTQSVVTADDFCRKYVCVTADGAAQIEAKTRAQASTGMWHAERRLRVTATLVKSVVCRRSNDFVPIIRRNLAPARYPTAAMRFGISHERDAVEEYLSHLQTTEGTSLEVADSGLVVCLDKPCLSASPDGILKDGDTVLKVVEVKCPTPCGTACRSKSSPASRPGSSRLISRLCS